MLYIKKHIFYLVIVIVLIFLFFDISEAQIDEKEPIDCEGDRIEYSEVAKEIRILGNVVIHHKDMKITADKVIVYPESKDIYATGNVFLYKDKDVFGADKVYYNFGTKKGTLIHGDFHSAKVFGEADILEKLSEKELRALKGYFTTCEFDTPHYRIEAKKIKIYLEDKVVAQNVVFYIGNFPFLYIPSYSYSLKENKPRVIVIPGHNKRWGYFLLTAWRYFFNERSKGWIHLDWREYLCAGEGIDYEYNTEKFGKGLLRAYYTQERNRLLKEHVPAEKEKYRITLEHEWVIDKDTKALIEYYRYEDKSFIKDYFYREFVKDPLPTSYISVTRKKAHYSLSALLRKRVNRFRTIVETSPELKYDVNNYKLGNTRFYYTGRYQFDSFNRKEAFTGHDTDAVRFHTDNTFRYPTRLIGYLDWIEFAPYVGHLETFYSKDKDGIDRDFFRGQWYSGYHLTTKIFRIFDVEGEFIGIEINKMRHLIIPSVSYTYKHEPTALSSKMGQFDGADSCARAKYYTFLLENKLQTKWYKKGTFDKERVNLLNHRMSVNLYPQIEGHQFSNITSSLAIRPKRWLNFNFTTSYNAYTRDFEVFNLAAEAEKSKWKLEVGSRYTQQGQFHEGIVETTFTLSPKWSLGIYERYDFQRKELVEQEYAFTRDLHCWIVELIWNTKEEETIWLVFKPKAFPDFPIEWVTSYHTPKVGSQSWED